MVDAQIVGENMTKPKNLEYDRGFKQGYECGLADGEITGLRDGEKRLARALRRWIDRDSRPLLYDYFDLREALLKYLKSRTKRKK